MIPAILRSVRISNQYFPGHDDWPEELDDDYDRRWFIESRPLQYFKDHMHMPGTETVNHCIQFDRPDVLEWIHRFNPSLNSGHLMRAIGRSYHMTRIVYANIRTSDRDPEYGCLGNRALLEGDPETYKFIVSKGHRVHHKGIWFIHPAHPNDFKLGRMRMAHTHAETFRIFVDEAVDLDMWANAAFIYGRDDLLAMIAERKIAEQKEDPTINILSIARSSADPDTLEKMAGMCDIDPAGIRGAKFWFELLSGSIHAIRFALARFRRRIPDLSSMASGFFCRLKRIAKRYGPDVAAELFHVIGPFDTKHIGLIGCVEEFEFAERISITEQAIKNLIVIDNKEFIEYIVDRPQYRSFCAKYIRGGPELDIDNPEICDFDMYPELLNLQFRRGHDLSYCDFMRTFVYQEFDVEKVDPDLFREHFRIDARIPAILINHLKFETLDWFVKNGLVPEFSTTVDKIWLPEGPGWQIYMAVKRYRLTSWKQFANGEMKRGRFPFVPYTHPRLMAFLRRELGEYDGDTAAFPWFEAAKKKGDLTRGLANAIPDPGQGWLKIADPRQFARFHR